jgi:hypothetical protein
MPNTILSGNPTGSFEEAQDSAFKVGNPQIYNLPTPTSFTTGPQTLTAAQVLSSIVVSAGSGAAGATAITLPTAAILAAGLRAFSSRGVVAGDTVMFLLINGNSSTGVLTVTSPGASVTFDPNQNAASQVVPANTSKEIYLRFTNGAPGSEAYVVYS